MARQGTARRETAQREAEGAAGAADGRVHGRVRRRHRVRAAVLLVLGAAVLGCVGAAVWLALDAVTVRDELTTTADLVATLQEEVVAGDAESARATLVTLQAHADAAHESAHGMHWSLAGMLPVVGPNVEAVQEVSEVVQDLSTDVLPGVVEASSLVDPAALARGDVPGDVAALQAAADTVVAADVAVQVALERLAAIDRDELLPEVASPVDRLEEQVAQVAEATARAAGTARLLPSLLGR